MFRIVIACFSLALFAGSAHAAALLTENFDDVSSLAGAGWVQTNNSAPLGQTDWFQGNAGIFTAQSGADDSYIAANFLNADFSGEISNWLILPEMTLNNGDTLTFYTRTEAGSSFPDRLEVRFSGMGASADVGSTSSSVGDFTLLLDAINPALDVGGYPEDWMLVTVILSGLSGPTDGRLALRYFVLDTDNNGNYIGIDTLTVTASEVPLPAGGMLLLSGLAGLGAIRRKNRTNVA